MDLNKIELSILNQKNEDILNTIKNKNIKNLHIDIMDGYFTDSLSSITPFLINNLNLGNLDLHMHFMVSDIQKYFKYYSNIKNIKYVSYHYEIDFIKESLYVNFNKKLQNQGIKIGLAINPSTKINDIKNIINNFDFILIMTVVPGKGGQGFIEESGYKIKEFKNIFSSIPIFIDGGVNNNIYEKYNKYVDRFIIGSYLFKN